MEEVEKAGIRQLWKISYPMMISFFSMMLMIFVDRLFLSWYSVSSLNASVQAGTLAWGIILGWVTMTTMSEVFVARYNGAKNYQNIGIPVWQMIWLSLFSTGFFLLLAIWGTSYIYNPKTMPEENAYLSCLMYFGPIFAIVPALGGFFIGRGRTVIMQWMALLGNAINIVLDPIFIFGIKGWVAPMGVVGAAIATGLGNLIQVVILFYLFVQKKNRSEFGTDNYKLNRKVFMSTVRVGLPPALFVTLELVAWSIFYHMMSAVSHIHILVASVCQSILILFIFFGLGVEKGAIAMAGNFIGAGKPEKIRQLLRSGMILIGGFFTLSILFLVIYPDMIINWFFDGAVLSSDMPKVTLSTEELATVKSLIRFGMICISIMILFENIRWLFNGVLTAAGDTLFLLISGVINVWCFLIMPTYFLVLRPAASIKVALLIWPLYGFIAALVIGGRFAMGRWKQKETIYHESSSKESIETSKNVNSSEPS